MTPSRARTGPARTLGPDVVEKRLDSLCTTHGVSHLNVIRDNARAVAPVIGREQAFDALDAMNRVLLQTREGKALTTQGQSRPTGPPSCPEAVGHVGTEDNFLVIGETGSL